MLFIFFEMDCEFTIHFSSLISLFPFFIIFSSWFEERFHFGKKQQVEPGMRAQSGVFKIPNQFSPLNSPISTSPTTTYQGSGVMSWGVPEVGKYVDFSQKSYMFCNFVFFLCEMFKCTQLEMHFFLKLFLKRNRNMKKFNPSVLVMHSFAESDVEH